MHRVNVPTSKESRVIAGMPDQCIENPFMIGKLLVHLEFKCRSQGTVDGCLLEIDHVPDVPWSGLIGTFHNAQVNSRLLNSVQRFELD